MANHLPVVALAEPFEARGVEHVPGVDELVDLEPVEPPLQHLAAALYVGHLLAMYGVIHTPQRAEIKEDTASQCLQRKTGATCSRSSDASPSAHIQLVVFSANTASDLYKHTRQTTCSRSSSSDASPSAASHRSSPYLLSRIAPSRLRGGG
jgi:hypothetical protein